jgi:predicted helicase
VTNGGWLDSNSADGVRKTLAEEFSDIHVFNLRGNQRTAGEQSRKEGGKIFGAGSRATVAITVLVKTPGVSGPATIHYRDVGDYLDREEKLRAVSEITSIEHLHGELVKPNDAGDWLDQRRADFGSWMPVGDRSGVASLFSEYSLGLATGRDAWVYNHSREAVMDHVGRMIAAYNQEVRRGADGGSVDRDPSRISWNANLEQDLVRGSLHELDPSHIRIATYRPFTKSNVYFDKSMNARTYRLPRLFPTPTHENHGFYSINPGADKPFSVLAVDAPPDLAMYGSNGGQYFPRWRYEPVEGDPAMFSTGSGEVVDGYRRIDNITDEAEARFQATYGSEITKDDIFFYVYGLLHSPDYRTTYAADLKKMLPRIPLVTDATAYVDAGRELCDLHIGYESVEPFPLDGLDAGPQDMSDAAYDFYRVEKMQFGKPSAEQKSDGQRADHTMLRYNANITLRGIPEEAYRYQLGARSAVEWIIDRYQVKVDKASGIRNDPNDWSREVGNPRYIVDLLARIVRVSLRTMEIVDALPPLKLRGP